jgi:hypothetical protein
MDVTLEIHAPGLDMAQTRWTHHLIFMQEIHQNLRVIFEQAKQAYARHGLGTLHVDREQWMQVVRDSVSEITDVKLPHTYLSAQEATTKCDFGLLTSGFADLIGGYDPQTSFVLTVEHHPGGLLSCYVIDPDGEGHGVIR